MNLTPRRLCSPQRSQVGQNLVTRKGTMYQIRKIKYFHKNNNDRLYSGHTVNKILLFKTENLYEKNRFFGEKSGEALTNSITEPLFGKTMLQKIISAFSIHPLLIFEKL